MTGLKPCPFCGWEAVIRKVFGRYRYRVVCSNYECGMSTRTYKNAFDAFRAWNRRVGE